MSVLWRLEWPDGSTVTRSLDDAWSAALNRLASGALWVRLSEVDDDFRAVREWLLGDGSDENEKVGG